MNNTSMLIDILSRHSVILIHGITKSTSAEQAKFNLAEVILGLQIKKQILCSTIGYSDIKIMGRSNYWSSFGVIVKLIKVLYACPEDAGSQNPTEFPEQLDYYMNSGWGPENFEKSILNRPWDQHNEIGLADYEICGWFLDLNPTSSLFIDMGIRDIQNLSDTLREWGYPCYAWINDTLKIVKSFEPFEYGDIISLSGFYATTS